MDGEKGANGVLRVGEEGDYTDTYRYWAIQAGLLTPLTFARHRLSPLAAFYFRCVLSSQRKAVTVNLRILYCQR